MFGSPQPGGQAASFKMIVMLPLLYFANKMDYTNQNLLMGLRVGYYLMQALNLAFYWYAKGKVESKKDMRKILVQLPPNPFGGEEKETHKETTYYDHEKEQLGSLLQQTLVGIVMVTVIHFKFNVNQMLVIQGFMAPLNLSEHGLFRSIVLGADRVWNEKFPGEEGTPTIGEAKPVVNTITSEGKKQSKITKDAASLKLQELDALILSTWDAGKDAQVNKLIASLDTGNIDYQTREGSWTALMVASGLKNTTEKNFQALFEMKPDPLLTDDDGCTALHWASYHNHTANVTSLLKGIDNETTLDKLLSHKSAENQTALDVAKELKNQPVIVILEKLAMTSKKITQID